VLGTWALRTELSYELVNGGFSVSAVESIASFQETVRVMYLVYVGHLFSSNKRTHRNLKKLMCQNSGH
jgi:hypothetical protein